MTGVSEGRVIGVDAGGTKTTAWISAADDKRSDSPPGTGEGGPGNPRAVGFDNATREIAAAIQAAWNAAGTGDRDTSTGRADVLCLSVAGAGRTQEQEELRRWALSQQLADNIVVTSDAEPILAAASPDLVGMALISGTGSFAWARTKTGDHHRVGGWGYLLGDDGSGYAIAVAGLRAALRAADGRTAPTPLLEAFMERLGATRPRALVESIYGTAQPREQIAGCADIVFAVAAIDPVARSILDQANVELAGMVIALAGKASFELPEFSLALSGGVLINQPQFREQLIRRIGISSGRAVLVPQPVAGAIAIAQRVVRDGTSPFVS